MSMCTEDLLGPFLSTTLTVSLNCTPGTCPPYFWRQQPCSLITDFSSHNHNTHVGLCYGDSTFRLYFAFVNQHHHQQLQCKSLLSTFFPLFFLPASKRPRPLMRGRSWAASLKIAIRDTPNLPNYCAISCNIHISYKYVRGPRVRYLGSKRPRKCMKVLYSTDYVHLKATFCVRPSTEYNKLHFTSSVSNVILFINLYQGGFTFSVVKVGVVTSSISGEDHALPTE
jgi:hypothetical protein